VTIRGGEQRIDFRTAEKADQGAGKALAGDGEHTLNLGRMGGQFQIPLQSVDGSLRLPLIQNGA
jgi:hypothetical protein